MQDNHKGEEDEDQGWRRGLMSLGDLGQEGEALVPAAHR